MAKWTWAECPPEFRKELFPKENDGGFVWTALDLPPMRNGEVFEIQGVVIYETNPGVALAAKEAVVRMYKKEAD